MITIHGSFVPAGATGFFFLWGLDSERELGASVRSRQAHPQALTVEELYWLARGIPAVNSVRCLQSAPFDGKVVNVGLPGLALSVPTAAQWLLELLALRFL